MAICMPEDRPRDTCFYDGACGLCRRSTRLLRALDWCDHLRFEDMLTADDLPVDLDVAMRGMPMRTREGRVLVGFAAVRRALRQTPLGVVPALALHLPVVSHLGDRVYRWVAARRGRACDVGSGAVPRAMSAAAKR